jgi:hypothetical protein
MGWSNQVVNQLIITAEGNGSGLFVYAGPPKKGNLLLAISSMGGIDPYGNEYSAVLEVSGLTTINSNGIFLYA